MEICDASDDCKELYNELEDYEKKGVSIMIDGAKASPLQIVTAHMVKEEGSYMRDYVLDDRGHIKTLMFVNVSEKNKYD